MTNTKLTKKDILTVIRTIGELAGETGWTVEKNGTEIEVTGEDLIDYADTTIEQLDRKADRAKERAQKAKAVGDELRAKVAAVLTNEYQSIAKIAEQVDVEDITPAKVSARLTQLVKAGEAHKTKIKTADGRKINGYAAGPAPETDEVDE